METSEDVSRQVETEKKNFQTIYTHHYKKIPYLQQYQSVYFTHVQGQITRLCVLLNCLIVIS